MATILHITESLGGGVEAALRTLIRNTPQHRHFLLAAVRGKDSLAHDWAQDVVALYNLPRGLFAALAAVREVYSKTQPDWVHLHSSFGGAFGRLALLPRRKIIYTPHCYAFERRDVAPLKRTIFRALEEILALGGATVAACCPHEATLANGLRLPQRVLILPNSVTVPDDVLAQRQTHQRGPRLRVVTVGRMAPQKDPAFFAATVALARQQNLPLDFVWIGGGDAAWEQKLRDAGATVTGWMAHADMLRFLASSDVYLHSAAWEACPMSILEAAALKLAIVARAIPSLVSLPITPTATDPAEACAALARLARGEDWPLYAAIAARLNQDYSATAQAQAAAQLYT